MWFPLGEELTDFLWFNLESKLKDEHFRAPVKESEESLVL